MNLVFCVLMVLKNPARHSRHYLVIRCMASRTDSENSLLMLAKRIPLLLTELNLGLQWCRQSFYAISYSVSLKRITQLAYDFDCTCLGVSCRFCKKKTILDFKLSPCTTIPCPTLLVLSPSHIRPQCSREFVSVL